MVLTFEKAFSEARSQNFVLFFITSWKKERLVQKPPFGGGDYGGTAPVFLKEK